MVPHMLTPGRTATIAADVAEGDLAVSLGSGDVRVLGTPRVLALLEQAAVEAVSDSIEGDTTTVGAWVELEHLAPTPLGGRVFAAAELVAVAGKRLEFTLRMTDDEGREVARGRHRRVVVARSRFPV